MRISPRLRTLEKQFAKRERLFTEQVQEMNRRHEEELLELRRRVKSELAEQAAGHSEVYEQNRRKWKQEVVDQISRRNGNRLVILRKM